MDNDEYLLPRRLWRRLLQPPFRFNMKTVSSRGALRTVCLTSPHTRLVSREMRRLRSGIPKNVDRIPP